MADQAFTEVVSDRLALRRFRLDDLATFVSYRSDPDVARYQSWTAPYSSADGDRLIRNMRRQHPDTPGEWFQFAITLRSTGELIGDCGAKPDAFDTTHTQIGYTIGRAHQRRGYGIEAVRTLLGYLFDARRMHRVTANCDGRNSASMGLLERVGMRREGVMLASVWAKGEWTDDVLYAMLSHEWAASYNRKGPTPAP
jgi:RimJ/RimL family protein N-acetyltransferase